MSYYEDAGRQAELTEVLQMLRISQYQGHLIKILTTAPMRSSLTSRFFDSNEVIDMAERYPHDGGFP